MSVPDSYRHLSPQELSGYDVERTKTLYKQGSEDGKLPGNRIQIPLLGDCRAGKTSLRKNLMNEKFLSGEEKTKGIDIQQTTVDNTWCMLKNKPNYFKNGLLWYIAINLSKERDDRERQHRGWRDICATFFSYVVMFLIASLCRLFYFFLPLTCKVAITIILCTLGLSLVVDRLSAYRYGGGFVLYILSLDAILRALAKFDMCKSTDIMDCPQLSFFLCIIIVYFFLGITLATGFRTGMAIAFSLMLIPMPEADVMTNWFESLTSDIRGHILEQGAISFGGFTGGLLFIFLMKVKPLTMSSRMHYLFELFAPILWLVLFYSVPSLSYLMRHEIFRTRERRLFCTGFLSAFAILTGLPFGRLIHSKLDASQLKSLPLIICFGLFCASCCDMDFPRVKDPHISSIIAVLVAILLVTVEVFRKRFYNNPAYVDEITSNLVQCRALDRKSLPMTLNFWDFGGDEFYYCSHHAFIANEAMFLLVFDMRRFMNVHNRDKELKRLVFWLHSINTNATNPSSLVFLVGTHRRFVAKEEQREIARYLKSKLYDSKSLYCNRLVINEQDNTPLFVVENSKGTDKSGVKNLRRMILKYSTEADFMKKEFPIRWRCFIDCVNKGFSKPNPFNVFTKYFWNNCTQKSKSVTPFIDAFNKARINCGIEDEEDMKAMLVFYHQRGDLIYVANDPCLSEYVIINPKVLIDAMSAIINIPEEKYRHPKMADKWNELKSNGIIHHDLLVSLLQAILGDDNDVKVIVKLLQLYDFICTCPIGEIDEAPPESCDTANEYMVPSMTPTCEKPEGLGPVKPYNVFYFDFGYFRPDAIFCRLMSRCIQKAHHYQVYANAGQFSKDGQYSCRLEVEANLPEQNLIKVVIKTVRGTNPFTVLGMLNKYVADITKRDSPNSKYKCGVLCQMPVSSTAVLHEGCPNRKMHHILPLASPSMNIKFPDECIGGEVVKHCNGEEQVINLTEPNWGSSKRLVKAVQPTQESNFREQNPKRRR
ncbi:uncharacterized protein LOC144444644 [Glandiceps talaboti]